MEAHTTVMMPSRTYSLGVVVSGWWSQSHDMMRYGHLKIATHHLHPAQPRTPSIYSTPTAMSPPNEVLNALAMNKYATLTPSSSRVYQLHRNKVIAGNKQPSKKPRKMRVVTRPPKDCTKPVHRQTRPQQKVMKGMTRLNWSRLTKREVGNSARM